MRNYGKISGDPDFVEAFHNSINAYERKEADWIKKLRSEGFKAAHPNDGWVDRENNKIHFAYPQFNDGAKIGDKIMIGCPEQNERPVIITREEGGLINYYFFKDM